MKKLFLYLLLVIVGFPLQAQTNYKYRISLADKEGTGYAVDHPEEFLSERALERRERQQLPIDSTDLPVSWVYLEGLTNIGAKIVTTSKWNNTAVVQIVDTLLVEQMAKLPFVTNVKKVWVQPDSIPPRDEKRKKEVTNKVEKGTDYYGKGYHP